MANEIDTGGSSSEMIAAEIVTKFVIPAAYGPTTVLKLVKHMDMTGRNSLVSSHNKWPDLTSSVSDRTDGSDLSNSDIDAAQISATVGSIGLMATVTDLFIAASVTSFQEVGTQLGYAIGQDIESKLCAEFADFTTDVGATGSDMTFENWLSAVYQIENGGLLDRGQIIGVLHPIQISDLRTDVKGETGTPLTHTDMNNLYKIGAVWECLGVPIYSSRRCASVNTNEDRRGAIMPRGDGCPIIFTRMWDPKVELQRDASMVAYELVATAAFGDECIDQDGGFGILTDHE